MLNSTFAFYPELGLNFVKQKMASLGYCAVVFIVLLADSVVRCFLVKDGNFQYFTYAQSWPPGTCAAGKFDHHTCHVGPTVNTWTVHGLWPSVWSGDEPFFCNKSEPFDFSKIASLQGQMNQFWPNLYNDTAYYSFWSHEWEKHGTCATSLEATSNEYNFFKQGLALNQRFNILNMLSKAKIVPTVGAQYSYSQFMNAIQASLGKDIEPVLGCAYEKLRDGTDYHLIEQIEICLDLNFNPISCYHPDTHKKGHSGHVHEPHSNCPQHYNFNYPPIQHV